MKRIARRSRTCRGWSCWSGICLMIVVAGCSSQSPDSGAESTAAPSVAAESEATSAVQRAKAMAAQQELFQRLSSRLMAVLSEQGPVAAIAVCSREAQEITKQVGAEQGVTIGRTSFRLRNGANLPPSWAAGFIQQREEEPQFVHLPNGQLGALLPIHLKPQCLLCHGAPETIPDEVQQELAKSYPDDQATGFEVDALRGWFWVEVPAPAGEG